MDDVTPAAQVCEEILQSLCKELIVPVNFTNFHYDYNHICPYPAGRVASGVLGAYAAIIAEIGRQQSGDAVVATIDVTLASMSLLSFAINHPSDGSQMPWKNLGVAVTYDYYRCSDGQYVYVHPGYRVDTFKHMLGIACTDSFPDASLSQEGEAAFWERKADIAQAIASFKSDEFCKMCNAAGLSATPARSFSSWSNIAQKNGFVSVTRTSLSSPEPIRGTQTGPLVGVRVLDITRILAAPVVAKLLSQQGADVLRIAAPDEVEDVGSFEADTCLGKRSTILDLKSDEGRATFAKLIKDCDILVENFAPGRFESLGFDESLLSKLRPGLIHVSVSCFGEVDHWHDCKGWEWVAQAATGIGIDIAGSEDKLPGVRLPMLACDYIAGYLGAAGAAAALIKRSRSGGGYKVQTSLCQAASLMQQYKLESCKDGEQHRLWKAPTLLDTSRVWSQSKFDHDAFRKFGITPELLDCCLMQTSTPQYGMITHLRPLVRLSTYPSSSPKPMTPRWSVRPFFLPRFERREQKSSPSIITRLYSHYYNLCLKIFDPRRTSRAALTFNEICVYCDGVLQFVVPAYIRLRLMREMYWYSEAFAARTFPVPSTRCPLPFIPESKMVIKRVAASLGIPVAKTLKFPVCWTDIEATTCKLDCFCLKPDIGGVSMCVYVVKDGHDYMHNSTFSVSAVVEEAKKMSYHGTALQSSSVAYPFLDILTSQGGEVEFIVEEALADESGEFPPRDFKFFVCAGKILAVMIMFNREAQWNAAAGNLYIYDVVCVDEDYNIMSQTWATETNPFVRRVIREKSKLSKRPDCWDDMCSMAKTFSSHVGLFCRCDMYATSKGAIFGELEFTPNPRMLSWHAQQVISQIWIPELEAKRM